MKILRQKLAYLLFMLYFITS